MNNKIVKIFIVYKYFKNIRVENSLHLHSTLNNVQNWNMNVCFPTLLYFRVLISSARLWKCCDVETWMNTYFCMFFLLYSFLIHHSRVVCCLSNFRIVLGNEWFINFPNLRHSCSFQYPVSNTVILSNNVVNFIHQLPAAFLKESTVSSSSWSYHQTLNPSPTPTKGCLSIHFSFTIVQRKYSDSGYSNTQKSSAHTTLTRISPAAQHDFLILKMVLIHFSYLLIPSFLWENRRA